jgi:hypothetical protein
MMQERRIFIRTAFPGAVKLTHPAVGELSLEMRDVSEGGLYLLTDSCLDLAAGETVVLQSLDMEDAPVVQAVVVRCEAAGIALCFVMD